MGATINGYAHYGSGFSNAFWDGAEVVFGDGDGSTYNPFTPIDIVGHEITHAITEYSAGLIYADESGGLNESFSDIFGVVVDFYANPTTANFLEGEQASLSGTPFRNMINPNATSQPDTYMGTFWVPAGGWDNGGVHTNSQVQNHWFYLLCQGGSGTNDIGNNFTVNGIGINDAAAIAYRNLSIYLTPNSTFADARYYAIQSALDLFGQCSGQVTQCTNAWYAVGVGPVFSNAVVAGFNTSQTFACTFPVTINFTNISVNGTSFTWDFGDGTTSTQTSPAHTYTATGTYNVQLIANGTALCGNADTLLQNNYITITNTGGPVSACSSAQGAASTYYGITQVTLNTINNSSADATEGYKDFTCTNQTSLVAGNPYLLNVKTVTGSPENVKVWIDYNNDGTMNSTSELVMTSLNTTTNHIKVINTSPSAVLNTPLRMRVYDESSTTTISGPCQTHSAGQTEDYTVFFTANTAAPLANFFANTTVTTTGSPVYFTDSTLNAPTAWQWQFQGGTPSTSSIQNPTVSYAATGTYQVKLVATNSFGTDSIVKIAYINVVSNFNMCSTTSTILTSGNLYDSGGPTGTYQNYENCSLLIDPGCATSITMTFSQFNTESGYDYLSIYNGINTSAPLLGTYTGSAIPPAVTANSGKMFVTFTTDGSVTYSGFAASWTSVVSGTVTPVASFSVSSSSPPLAAPVQFTDQTSNLPNNWFWDFGDGSTSTAQNPSHTYLTSGSKTVTLIASNCVSTDTVTQVLNVQTAPDMLISPDTISVNVNCGDSAVIPVTIYNNGTGTLVYNSAGSSAGGQAVEVLMCTYGADMTTEYPNTVNAISQYFTNYNITQYTGTTASGLQSALTGIDVVIFPEQETGTNTHYTSYASTLQSFVSNGGIVIFCGAGYLAPNRMFDAGLFTGTAGSIASSGTASVVNMSDSITQGLPAFITLPNATDQYMISNSDKIQLVTYSGYDIVFYRNIGSGKAICVSADYFNIDANFARMLANSVKLGSANSGSALVPSTGTINAGDSLAANVIIYTTGQTAGTYTTTVNVNSNDPSPNPYPVVVVYTVAGTPNISVSSSCINFGSIYQYASETDSVIITNTGCSTLNITSMSTAGTAFTFSPSTFSVAPGASQAVLVTFNPQSIGNYSDTLVVNNNATTQMICLTGTATTAPDMVLSDDTISVSLSACNASTTVNLNVANIGGANLTYTVNGTGATGPVDVLVMTQYVDMAGEYNNMVNAINQYYTNYTLTQFTSGTASQLQSALSGKEVLLIPEQETYAAGSMATYSTVIQNFANNGGTVIMCGTYNASQNNLNDIGLIPVSYVYYTSSGGMQVLDTTHAVTKNLPLNISAQNATMYITPSTSVIPLVKYTGYDVVCVKNFNSGKAVYIGYDFYAYDADAARIISNAIKSPLTSSLPSWIQATPTTGTVTPSGSSNVQLTFNSGGLTAGTYTINLIIASNDPLQPTDTVVCILTVGNNPCVDFSYNVSGNCSGVVNFNDSIINTVTSWSWNFGDGSTSTTANPSHTYSAAGNYTVTLIGCNGTVCDTSTQVVNIVAVGGPIAASCTPLTTANCCGMGILNVTLNTINFSSPDGSENCKDNTCTQQTTLTVGSSYQLSVTTSGGYSENVSAWIDYNNDGVYTSPEQVMTNMQGYGLHQVTFTPPSGAVINTPLRMRVISDYYNNSITGACYTPYYGQCEDYSVILQPSTVPPVANFSSTINSCQGLVTFTDNSTNYPTSWLWNFGDGGASSQQNPTHTYTAPGTYTVSLIATNAYGSSFYTTTVTVNPLTFSLNHTGTYQIGSQISFSTNLNGGTSYTWDFGDGYLAGLQNPVHSYQSAGTYIVSLTIISGGCVNTMYDTITISVTGVEQFEIGGNSLAVYPNPFINESQVNIQLRSADQVSVRLLDLSGKLVKEIIPEQFMAAGKYTATISDVAQGVYLVQIQIGSGTRTVRLVAY